MNPDPESDRTQWQYHEPFVPPDLPNPTWMPPPASTDMGGQFRVPPEVVIPPSIIAQPMPQRPDAQYQTTTPEPRPSAWAQDRGLRLLVLMVFLTALFFLLAILGRGLVLTLGSP